MRDYILTAPSEQDLITALPEYRISSEDSEQWAGNVFAPCTRWIARPAYDAEGEQTSPGETIPGYHLILRAESLPEAARPYLVTDPGDIEPVPAGGLLTPVVPQSVTKRQALLVLYDAGLTEGGITAILEGISDPVVRDKALIEWVHATTIDRTAPLIAVVQSDQGWTDAQIDELFIQAATL